MIPNDAGSLQAETSTAVWRVVVDNVHDLCMIW